MPRHGGLPQRVRQVRVAAAERGAAERSLCPAEEGARGGGECALVGHAQELLLSLSFS